MICLEGRGLSEELSTAIDTRLRANHVQLTYQETAEDFLKWCLLSNKALPDLFITDIDISDPSLVKPLQAFAEVNILLVDQLADEFTILKRDNIQLFTSYEDLLVHIEQEYPVDEMMEGMPGDFSSQVESINNYDDVFEDSSIGEDPRDDAFALHVENEAYASLYGGDQEVLLKDHSVPPNFNEFNDPSDHAGDASSRNLFADEQTEVLEDNGAVHANHNADEIFLMRSKEIRRQWSKSLRWRSHRTIGVWSPLHRTGVTSFSFNYAFYLAENGIKSAVLEGLTDNYTMKDWLRRYGEEPDNWSSLASAIHSDQLTNETLWEYGDVRFFPLDQGDTNFDWNSNSLRYLIQTTNEIKATLIDLPTGKMSDYTKDSLTHMDELWIIVDDAIQETIAWKEYISGIKKQVDIPFQLIFNKEFPFSQSKRLAEELDVPLLVTLPSLHEETMRNYYENTPLYFQKEVAALLEDPFKLLTNHLFTDTPEIPLKQRNKSRSYFKLTKKIEHLLKKW